MSTSRLAARGAAQGGALAPPVVVALDARVRGRRHHVRAPWLWRPHAHPRDRHHASRRRPRALRPRPRPPRRAPSTARAPSASGPAQPRLHRLTATPPVRAAELRLTQPTPRSTPGNTSFGARSGLADPPPSTASYPCPVSLFSGSDVPCAHLRRAHHPRDPVHDMSTKQRSGWWRRMAMLASITAGLSSGCASSSDPSPGPSVPAPGPSEPAPPSRPREAPAAPACVPWTDAVSLVASSQAGRPDFVRSLELDFETGVVRVHDSDPFATGQEASPPRVIDESIALSPAARDRLVRSLLALCPSAEAMARRCAPGGCMQLVVTDGASRTTRVEDASTVRAVMQQLSGFFPQLRAQ